MSDGVVIFIIVLLVILMIHKPKRTTAQITAGEGAVIGIGETVISAAFSPPQHRG